MDEEIEWLNLKFPRYSGWLHKSDSVFSSSRCWFVLSNGKIHYYKDWRQNFYSNVIDVKGVSIEEKPRSISSLWFKFGDLYLKAPTTAQKNKWMEHLKSVKNSSVEDIEAAIDECSVRIRTTRDRAEYPDLIQRLLGVMTISKDATTHRDELVNLAEYLCKKGYGRILPELYKHVFDNLQIASVTEEMLEKASQNDNVDEGWMLLYLIRRLLWRYAFASRRFALQMTETCYIAYIVNDLRELIRLSQAEWNDGNYLMFSTLNCLQQCARSPCKRDIFYHSNAIATIGELRRATDSNKVKFASLLTLSHMVEAEDFHLLKIDAPFMEYFIGIITKAVEHQTHFAVICSKVGHLTEVRELFDALSKVYRLHENQEIINSTNTKSFVSQLHNILKVSHVEKGKQKSDVTEKQYALQLMGSICTFSVGRRFFEREECEDVLATVKVLTMHEDLLISSSAKKIQEYFKRQDKYQFQREGNDVEELYVKALASGSTLDQTIRVMLVGHAGAGKTTLCKRIIGDNIIGIRSTEGIDIYIQKFLVDLNTNNWTIDVDDDVIQNCRAKIARAVKDYELQGVVNEQQLAETQNVLPEETIASPDYEITRDLQTPTCQTISNEDISRKENLKEIIRKNFETESTVILPECFAHASVWDFAGEDVFYATHHVFMSPDAVYLLVIDLSNAETNNKIEIEKAQFWIRSIFTYAKVVDSDTDFGFRLPPVILIVTHKDKLPGKTEKERIDVAYSYLSMVLDIPELQGIDLNFIRGKFVIDNTEYDPEIEKIKDCIVDSAALQMNWKKKIPISWVAVEREINTLKSKGQKILSTTSLLEHMKGTESALLSMEDICLILKFFHQKGILLFFPNSKYLQKIVFIDPQWVVNAFKCLITVPSGVKKLTNPILRRHRRLLESEGKLTREFVTESFLSKDDRFSEHEKTLINSMEELNLIAKVDTHWIVPSMLKRETYCKAVENVLNEHFIVKSCAYCLRFRECFVPDPIFDKIISACISKWPNIFHFNGKPIIYRGLAVLQVSSTAHLVLYCKDYLVQAMMFRPPNNEENDLFCKVGNSVRDFLYTSVMGICESYQQESMKPYECIQCKVLEPDTSTPALAEDIYKYDQRFCCTTSLSPHKLTHEHLQQWWDKVEKYRPALQDIYTTPPESPRESDDEDSSPNLPYILPDLSSNKNKFKRRRDSTMTIEEFDNLRECSQSIGCLRSQMELSTVFRVGPVYVMTVAHHVANIIGGTSFTQDIRRIHNSNIYVEFKGKPSEPNKQFLLDDVLYIDDIKDVCVLKLVGKVSDFPPALREFRQPEPGSVLSFIGFGHPNHDYKTIETKVKILPHNSVRINKARQWVNTNAVILKNVLQMRGQPHELVDQAYATLEGEGIVGLNCFMEKGSSGSPGLVMTDHGPSVAMILQGGLPTFYWNIGEYSEQVPVEHRIEYGISIYSVRKDIMSKRPCLGEEIFGKCDTSYQVDE